MRHGVVVGVMVVLASHVLSAAPARRRPLDPRQREAVLVLLKAVDRAQDTDVLADAALTWENQGLKSGDQTAYVPFRLTLPGADLKSPAMCVRAVSRREGMRTSDEHSALREWLLHGGDVMPRMPETVWVGAGEMAIGGLALFSSRQSTAAAAAASGALLLQQRDYEKQKAAMEAAKKLAETRQRVPYLFPFE